MNEYNEIIKEHEQKNKINKKTIDKLENQLKDINEYYS